MHIADVWSLRSSSAHRTSTGSSRPRASPRLRSPRLLANSSKPASSSAAPMASASMAIRFNARQAHARPASTEFADAPDQTRKVLRAFVADGRLQSMPVAASKKLVILDWLAQDFEPGTTYSEKMVNLILGKRHSDTAMLRRYLVDHGFLDRAEGQYWRSGGTVAE